MSGAFVVSLDFELLWGMRDHQTIAMYGENIVGARLAIPRLLDLFDRYNVACTWATVGMLMFDDRDELLASLPSTRPRYNNPDFSPYQDIGSIGANEVVDPYHFGLSLVRLIQSAPGQEIATHTFSHYYCLEAGQTLDAFRADIQAAVNRAGQLGIKIKSIVFPYNQYGFQHLSICADMGLSAFRGYQSARVYHPSLRRTSAHAKRMVRLADSYIDLTGSNPSNLIVTQGLVDVSASRFLRPFSAVVSSLDKLKLRRITDAMERCARRAQTFHLWFHPHNFGKNQSENFAALEIILRKYSELQKQYDWRACTMAEFANDNLNTGSVAQLTSQAEGHHANGTC